MEIATLSSNKILLYFFTFIFGSVVGSFLNVCIYRLPRGESIVFPSSHCRKCWTPIKSYHNIPILSYIFLKGRCSTCRSSISPIYPVIELLTGLTTLFLFYKFGLTFQTFIYLILLFSLIVISFIDLEHMIIPNIITLPGILVGFIFSMISTNWDQFKELVHSINFSNIGYMISKFPALDSFLGIIFGGGILLLIASIYKLIRKREGMGMGDVKLLAMLGAFLGINGVLFIIFLSSLIGSVVGISLIVYNKGDLKFAMPYGPFLSLAAVIYMFIGGLKIIF